MKLPTVLMQTLEANPAFEFSMPVGSRTNGIATSRSNRDITLDWNPQLPWLTRIVQTENLRRHVAAGLQVFESQIDLAETNLTIRAIVAEEGVPLTGESTSGWPRFLRRAWRELELLL